MRVAHRLRLYIETAVTDLSPCMVAGTQVFSENCTQTVRIIAGMARAVSRAVRADKLDDQTLMLYLSLQNS
jgi:hypothetical protein